MRGSGGVKFDAKNPPRRYRANGATISDCGTLLLAPDEQVTFVTEQGAEYDVARKDWGFYATPSLNRRLAQSGLRGALVANDGKLFVLLVEAGREPLFQGYLDREGARLVTWLDTDEAVGRLLGRLHGD